MLDIFSTLQQWVQSNETVAIATVVKTWGSSPRQAGAMLGLTATGQMVGSVSGGCVETAVVQAGQTVLAADQPQLLHYGIADEMAWDVGLACGGNVDIFVQPLTQLALPTLQAAIAKEETIAIATLIASTDQAAIGQTCILTNHDDDQIAHEDAVSVLLHAHAQHGLATKTCAYIHIDADTQIFVNVIIPAPKLIAVGGVHITQALFGFAKPLGFRTVLIEPRQLFGSADRFTNADELCNLWPDAALDSIVITPSTAIAVLSHDPKLDDPALIAALQSKAYYVGALGSRKTQASRRMRLLAAGVDQAAIDRLHGPIGLNLGGRQPAEIALAIMAEIVQEQYQ